MTNKMPKVLMEDWLPIEAIGAEGKARTLGIWALLFPLLTGYTFGGHVVHSLS